MNNTFRHILVVLVPLIFSNVIHMIIVKRNFLNAFNLPLSVKLFGENKTWRGFIFVPVLNGMILVLLNAVLRFDIQYPALLGFILGLAYMVFELPNSFLKRKLGLPAGQGGIKPGEQHNRMKFLFSVMDKTDSSFGVALTYFLLGYIGLRFAICLFLINAFTHALLSQLLVVLGIKKNF
ncbi:MAG: hypothetical protein ABI763_10560 [Bacteroidota bacterium]